MKRKETCRIIKNDRIAEGIYSLWLEFPGIIRDIQPGQFVSLYMRDRARILPRPVSICETDAERGCLRLVYRVTGKGTGTEELSHYHPGVCLEAAGPLGNGFPLDQAKGKKVLLIGGGIGIPPMLETARKLDRRPAAVLGFRDETFLTEDFNPLADVFTATEDGSAGTEGTVLDAIMDNHIEADMIFACGPKPMLRAVKEYAMQQDIPCWISMEERMACGIGACLGCVCKTVHTDPHSHVKNARVCKDGPVFLSTEVEL